MDVQETINAINQIGSVAEAISNAVPSVVQAISVVVGSASAIATVFPTNDSIMFGRVRSVINLLALNVGWAANKH